MPTPPGSAESRYYWQRRHRRVAPVLVGALGLASLGAVQLVPVRDEIQADLAARSRAALAAAGLHGVDVELTGQDATLTGAVASQADVERALRLVAALEGIRVAISRVRVSATPSVTLPPGPGPAPSGPAPSGPAPSGPAPSGPAPSGPAPSGPGPLPPAVVLQQQLRALPPIAFDCTSPTPNPAGATAVARAAALIKAVPKVKVRVEGFTDDIGEWSANLALSRQRAEVVRGMLIAAGVPADRLSAVGYSEDWPKVPNTSAANRALNRRVELDVLG